MHCISEGTVGIGYVTLLYFRSYRTEFFGNPVITQVTDASGVGMTDVT